MILTVAAASASYPAVLNPNGVKPRSTPSSAPVCTADVGAADEPPHAAVAASAAASANHRKRRRITVRLASDPLRLVAMRVRHSKAADRVAFEIEFDQH